MPSCQCALQERSWHGARYGWTSITSTCEVDTGGDSLFLGDSSEFNPRPSRNSSISITGIWLQLEHIYGWPTLPLTASFLPFNHSHSQEGQKFVSGSRALTVCSGEGFGSGFGLGLVWAAPSSSPWSLYEDLRGACLLRRAWASDRMHGHHKKNELVTTEMLSGQRHLPCKDEDTRLDAGQSRWLRG